MKFDGADFESFSISSHDTSPMSVMGVVIILSLRVRLCFTTYKNDPEKLDIPADVIS